MGYLQLIIKGFLCTVLVGGFFLFGTEQASAQATSKEAYRWEKYNSIKASLGGYNDILEGDSRYLVFTQNKEAPLDFTAQVNSEECSSTLTLSLDQSSAAAGRISSAGNCPAASALGSTVKIDGASGVVSSVEAEENALHRLYTNKTCTGSNNTEPCKTTAAEEIKRAQETCLATHNYKKHIAYSDLYLDCVADTLGVKRPDGSAAESLKDAPRSCQIPNGWAICQITELIAQNTDNVFILLKPFLTIEPLKTETDPGTESLTYTTWKNIRDIANVLIILGLLVVIFSHLTGLGIQAYHIKKGLPRLIIAALLINMSFYICMFLVDASNIAGKTAQDTTEYFSEAVVSQSPTFVDWETTATRILSTTPNDPEFTALSSGIDPSAEEEEEGKEEEEEEKDTADTTTQTTDDSSEELKEIEPTKMLINGQIITGSAVLYANLAILLPVMVFALFAVFAALMILLFRQALVMVLIIIAPLAFAAIMLPGTKKWYEKWQSVLIQLLLVYPIIALLFAASQLASKIIQDSAMNSGHTLMAIFSLGIQMIPLFVSPLLLKFSGSAVNQFAGAVQGVSKTPRGYLMNKAKERGRMAQDTRNARLQAGRIGPRGRYQVPGGATIGQFLPSNIIHSARRGYRLKEQRQEGEYRKAAAGKIGDYLGGITDENLISDMKSGANAEILDINMKEINATVDMYNRQGIEHDAMFQMAHMGIDTEGNKLTDIQRRAAIRIAMKNGSESEVQQLFEMAQTQVLGDNVAQEVVSAANKEGISAEAFHITHGAKSMATQGEGSPEETMASAINNGKLSTEAAPNQSVTTYQKAIDALNTAAGLEQAGGAATDDRRKISRQARKDFTLTVIAGFITKQSGDASDRVRNKMSELINDSLRRGDISYDDVAKTLSQATGPDKAKAFGEIFGESMRRGEFDMRKALESQKFSSELLNDPSISNSLFGAGIKSMSNNNLAVHNTDTIDFYTESIRHHTSSTQSLDELGAAQNFMQDLRSKIQLESIPAESMPAARSLIDEYNRHMPPERRI